MGGGDSLACVSSLLALKLLPRPGSKGAGDIRMGAVSEQVFPFAAPLGLTTCSVDDSDRKLGSASPLRAGLIVPAGKSDTVNWSGKLSRRSGL